MKKVSVTGIIILISIAPLFRGLYFNYETYGFLAALALLSIIYLFTKVMHGEPIRTNKWFLIIGILLLAAIGLSFIKAVNPRENLESLFLYTELIIISLVLYDYFYEKKQRFIQAIMLPAVITGFVCAAVGLISLTGSFFILNVTVFESRIGSTFQYTNTAAIYFAICIIFALTLANAAKSLVLRIIMTGIGNILVYALFMTGSRGVFLVFMAVVLLFLAIQPSGRRFSGIISFVFMLAPVFITLKGYNAGVDAHDNMVVVRWLIISFLITSVLFLLYILSSKILFREKSIQFPKGSGYVVIAFSTVLVILAFIFRDKVISILPPLLSSRLANLSLEDMNVFYRVIFFRDAFKLIAENWLFGLGGGGWKSLYQSVQDNRYIAVFVHNNYLQVFVEAGILGFVSYLAVVSLTALNAVYSWFKAVDKALKTYAAGLLCSFLALVLHSALDFDLSYTSMALLFWVMFAASAVKLPALVNEHEGGGKGYLSAQKHVLTLRPSLGKTLLIVVCSVLFSMNALYFAGAYNGHEGLKNAYLKDYKSAMACYEEAVRLDSGNPAYYFELAKLYNYFAKRSTDKDEKQLWLNQARTVGEKSISIDRYYPAYLDTLVQTYLASDMPLKALEKAEMLVTYQPGKGSNYTLLVNSYYAAAKYYEKNGNEVKAKELFERGKDIEKNPERYRTSTNKLHDVNSDEMEFD